MKKSTKETTEITVHVSETRQVNQYEPFKIEFIQKLTVPLDEKTEMFDKIFDELTEQIDKSFNKIIEGVS